jgi:hypothetical protein
MVKHSSEKWMCHIKQTRYSLHVWGIAYASRREAISDTFPEIMPLQYGSRQVAGS